MATRNKRITDFSLEDILNSVEKNDSLNSFLNSESANDLTLNDQKLIDAKNNNARSESNPRSDERLIEGYDYSKTPTGNDFRVVAGDKPLIDPTDDIFKKAQDNYDNMDLTDRMFANASSNSKNTSKKLANDYQKALTNYSPEQIAELKKQRPDLAEKIDKAITYNNNENELVAGRRLKGKAREDFFTNRLPSELQDSTRALARLSKMEAGLDKDGNAIPRKDSVSDGPEYKIQRGAGKEKSLLLGDKSRTASQEEAMDNLRAQIGFKDINPKKESGFQEPFKIQKNFNGTVTVIGPNGTRQTKDARFLPQVEEANRQIERFNRTVQGGEGEQNFRKALSSAKTLDDLKSIKAEVDSFGGKFHKSSNYPKLAKELDMRIIKLGQEEAAKINIDNASKNLANAEKKALKLTSTSLKKDTDAIKTANAELENAKRELEKAQQSSPRFAEAKAVSQKAIQVARQEQQKAIQKKVTSYKSQLPPSLKNDSSVEKIISEIVSKNGSPEDIKNAIKNYLDRKRKKNTRVT